MSITVAGPGGENYRADLRAEKGMGILRLVHGKKAHSTFCIVIPHTEMLAWAARVRAATHAPDSVEQFPEIDDVAKAFGLTPVEPDEWGETIREIDDAPLG